MEEITLELLAELLDKPETYELEFKSGRKKFSYAKLGEYCSAMASSIDGTGYIIIGVSNADRKFIHTNAFQDPGKTESELAKDLGIKPRVKELYPDNKRVVVVQVPGDRNRMISFKGACYKREGESVRPMTGPEIEAMAGMRSRVDYSAQLSAARFEDLDPGMIATFRQRCRQRDPVLQSTSETDEEFLTRLRLIKNGQATYAAIILFGTEQAILTHINNARIRYRWHASKGVAPPSDEVNYVQGYLGVHDEIWEKIDSRNQNEHYLDKFYRIGVPVYDKDSVREAIINAVAHRDYAVAGHIHVVQHPDGITIANPGGFPAGFMPDGMSPDSRPRNQLLADAFYRASMIEQAGYGIQLLNSRAIRLGRELPDYSASDEHRVNLWLDGSISNEDMLIFFERNSHILPEQLSYVQYLVLFAIAKGEAVESNAFRSARKQLLKEGAIESHGSGRGTTYYLAGTKPSALKLLSAKTIEAIDDGLLVLIELSGAEGISTTGMSEVIKHKTYKQIRSKADYLANDGLIKRVGNTKDGRWVITKPGTDLLAEMKHTKSG